MKRNKIFNYKNQPISFQKGDQLLINATEMAKSFGKKPNDWLKHQQSKDIINSILKSTNLTFPDLVQVRKGNPVKSGGGTWMHEDLALAFAQWLSPDFYVWCNSKIKELLTTGVATLDLISRKEILKMALEAEEELEKLSVLNQIQSKKLEENEPKVVYYDNVLQSDKLIPITVIAKEFGMSAIRFNRLLHELRIIYKCGDTWVLYSKYQNQGLADTKTYLFTDKDHIQKTRTQLYWTEKGRKFIHEQLFDSDFFYLTNKNKQRRQKDD